MNEFSYDIFISYRWITPDQEWVREQLHPALLKSGLKVCLDVEDFVPGRDLILEMERAGTESRHILCIISPDYLSEGRMVEFESLSARRRDPGGRNSTLIPLVLRQTVIPERIRGLIPINWIEPNNHSREWRKLLGVLKAKNSDISPPGNIQLKEDSGIIVDVGNETSSDTNAGGDVKIPKQHWPKKIAIFIIAISIFILIKLYSPAKLAIFYVEKNSSKLDLFDYYKKGYSDTNISIQDFIDDSLKGKEMPLESNESTFSCIAVDDSTEEVTINLPPERKNWSYIMIDPKIQNLIKEENILRTSLENNDSWLYFKSKFYFQDSLTKATAVFKIAK